MTVSALCGRLGGPLPISRYTRASVTTFKTLHSVADVLKKVQKTSSENLRRDRGCITGYRVWFRGLLGVYMHPLGVYIHPLGVYIRSLGPVSWPAGGAYAYIHPLGVYIRSLGPVSWPTGGSIAPIGGAYSSTGGVYPIIGPGFVACWVCICAHRGCISIHWGRISVHWFWFRGLLVYF